MKSLLSVLALVAISSGSALAQSDEFNLRRGGPGGGFPGHGPGHGREPLTPVHRFFNGADHFLTLNPHEGYNAGYRYEGVGFMVFQTHRHDRIPIFRCHSGQNHFVSPDQYCEGRIYEGFYGFIATRRSRQAPRELVRCYRTDHLITVNRNECYQNGYIVEAVLGYVP